MLLIRPTELSDITNLQYRNDPSIWMNLTDVNMFSKHEIENWLKNLPRKSKRYSVVVQQNGDEKFVGLAKIDNIDETNRNCWIGLDIIPTEQGKGYSRFAYNCLLNYLFNQMNMNAIYLYVLDSNLKGIHVYEKLGFVKTGILQEAIFRDGKYHDYILYCLLRKNWDKSF